MYISAFKYDKSDASSMDQKFKLFLFGLDNAGKSTLFEFMKEGTIAEDLEPTREFNVIDLFINDISYYIWDAPGQIKYRKNWAEGIKDTASFLYVVDLADNQRFNEAKKELTNILNNDEARGIPLIICFHKIDLKESQNHLKEALNVLNPQQNFKERDVYWLITSVYRKEGVKDLKIIISQLSLKLDAEKNLASIQKKYSSN